MKIFGLEINISKSKKEENKTVMFDVSHLEERHAKNIINELTNKSLFLGGYIDQGKIVSYTKNDFISRIKWPSSDHLDEFELIEYNKARHDLLKSACSYSGGHFNICPFHTLRDMGFYELKDKKKEAYDKLKKLHCVDFIHIPLNVRSEMIDLINFIFTEDDEEILDGEFSVEPQKLLQ